MKKLFTLLLLSLSACLLPDYTVKLLPSTNHHLIYEISCRKTLGECWQETTKLCKGHRYITLMSHAGSAFNQVIECE